MKSQRKNACMQLVETATTAKSVFNSVSDEKNKVELKNCNSQGGGETDVGAPKDACQSGKPAYDTDAIRKCVNDLKLGISKAKRLVEQERNRSYRDR